MGEAKDRKPFTLDAVQTGVTQPRATATSTAPYRQPQATGTPSGTLPPFAVTPSFRISFDTSQVDTDPTMNQAITKTKTTQAYNLFCQIAKRGDGKTFLKEIADFPNNLVFETDSDGEDAGLSAAEINKQIQGSVPKVKDITVIFVSSLPTEGDVGSHEPSVPASSYKIWILIKEDDLSKGSQTWPSLPGCKPDIVYNHKKSESQMVVTMFHELVHIWFVFKYWVWGGQSDNNLGHETYTPCRKSKPFFTEVLRKDGTQFPGNARQPFYDMLRRFYQEADTIESTQIKVPPLAPQPPLKK